jgi:hypothetical protein
MAEFWIERTIEDMKSEIKKRSNKTLVKKSKNEDELSSRFRDFLLIAEKEKIGKLKRPAGSDVF